MPVVPGANERFAHLKDAAPAVEGVPPVLVLPPVEPEVAPPRLDEPPVPVLVPPVADPPPAD